MRDYLAWRLAIGVTTPSTNTVVQPEYDDMRPPGVTNHVGRMVIPNISIASNEEFDESIRLIDAALEDAVASVMDCKPNAFALGISALAVWGGNLQWGADLKRRIRKVAGFDIPVALATDAVFRALQLHGVKRRIAIMEPYYPSIEPKMEGIFGAKDFEIVRYSHMRGKSPATYSMVTAQDMISAIRSIDGPDVEAIVQFGANLPMARIADEAERWLNKPVISVNVATYWHALRMNGVNDQMHGFTSLLSKF
jgi:maleate isomerase